MNALQTTLKQLRLSGLIQTLDVRLQEAAANRLSHAEFLELICQDELNVRLQRQIEALQHDLARHRLLEVEAFTNRAGGRQEFIGGEVESHSRRLHSGS